jgi:hypothetical protein
VFGTYADKREAQAIAPTSRSTTTRPRTTPDRLRQRRGRRLQRDLLARYLLAQPKLDVTSEDGEESVTDDPRQRPRDGGRRGVPVGVRARVRGEDEGAVQRGDAALGRPAGPVRRAGQPRLVRRTRPAFLRFFCQGGWVGGWKTEQRRSYFAVKLPQRWWLLGIDIQFDTYIDAPQIDYFRTVAAAIEDGDGIILCNAKPSWVEGGKPRSNAYATLDYFITVVLGKDQDQVRLMLAGDQHHYARYAEVDGERALITCGGGGAYLSATRLDKDGLTLPPATLNADVVDKPPPSRFAWRAAYPTPAESRRLALRVFHRLPGRNPWFVALMAGIQALAAYAVVSSLWRQSAGSGTLAEEWAGLTPAWSVADALREPRTVLAALLLVGSMVLFSKRGGPRGVVGGLVHGLGHVLAVLVAVWVAAWLPVPAGWADEAEVAARLGWAAVVGGVLATVVVAGYLYLAARLLDLHLNELFSAQSDEHHKSFLRLHIRDNGDLVVHPAQGAAGGHELAGPGGGRPERPVDHADPSRSACT